MFSQPTFRHEPRRPDPVTLIWVVGAAIAILAYAIGPDRVVAGAFSAFNAASWYLDRIVHNLTAATLQGLRAVAIGLFIVFVGLSLLAIRRQAHGPTGLIVVTIVFLLLIWGAEGNHPSANARWTAALVIAALAALGATRRLARPPAPPHG